MDIAERTHRCRAKVAHKLRGVMNNDKALGKSLEKALWIHTLTTCDRDRIPKFWDNPRLRYRYTTKALSLAYNLRTNDALRAKVAEGTLDGAKVLAMKPWEMKPELWEAAFDAVAKRELRNSEYNPDPATVPDGAYTCGKCKSKKTSFYMVQTRSADEPSTVFVQCLMCRTRWRTT